MTTQLLDAQGEKLPRKYKVLVAIPTQDLCAAGFAHDLARMAGFVGSTRPDIQLLLFTSRGTIIPQQRTSLVKDAIAADATHILWLDSDMRFPPDVLSRLLAHNETIVAANYPTRRPPIVPTAASSVAGLIFTTHDSTGLEEVDRVGMGCMLVDMTVFKALDAPWFALGYLPKLNDFVGEDVFFCQKAARHGFPTLIDHDLSKQVSHLGEFPYQNIHAEQTRDAMIAEQEARESKQADGVH